MNDILNSVFDVGRYKINEFYIKMLVYQDLDIESSFFLIFFFLNKVVF